MYIREAVLKDKEKWDSFVDTEGGSFFHYFDWKYIYEASGQQYIPLVLENESSEIIGILPIVKQKGKFYSSIDSQPEGSFGGFVLKKDLSISEKNKAISLLLNHVKKNISIDCSSYNLKENLLLLLNDKDLTQPTEILIKNGFEYKYNPDTQLPCTYILELKQPFEKFDTLDEAMGYVGSRFTVRLEDWVETSVLFKDALHQERITKYLP